MINISTMTYMKSLKYIFGLTLLAASAAGVSSCQDDIDAPGLDNPVAEHKANITIKELKEMYWQDLNNYTVEVGKATDSTDYYIAGCVISSDDGGNIFKKIVLQDSTGAITFSIDSYNLAQRYRRGQELVIRVTGLTIGKYAGLMQFGIADTYLDGTQTSFMSRELFALHTEFNGLPELDKIDTLVFDSFDQLPMSTDGLIKNQSQLVRLNNVKFINGGKEKFSNYHENVSQYITDGNGNGTTDGPVAVRTSGYSNFWNNTLPTGSGDLVGILSYYASGSTSNWQLELMDIDGCMNFGNPTLPAGSRTNPYSTEKVIELAEQNTYNSGWATGYIVGAVAPGVSTVFNNEDIEWGAEVSLPNTLVVAPAPEVKDYSQCFVIELRQNSTLRYFGNLVDHPDNLGRQIWINGSITKALGMAAVNSTCANDAWEIDGVEQGEIPVETYKGDFDSFNNSTPKASPYGTYTNATGWTAENSIILGGSSSGEDANPRFTFIGLDNTLAPTLNGKASAPGRLISPTLNGGIGTLKFNYGFAFTDSQCSFTVNIYQGDVVVKTETVNVEKIDKSKVIPFAMPVNISGDFKIEIVNNHIGNATANKERVSIWNLTWTE